MGRHGAGLERHGLSGQVAVVLSAAVVAIVLLAVFGWGVLRGSEGPSTPTAAAASSSSEDSAGESSTASPSSTSTGVLTPQAALAACEEEVSAAEDVKKAADGAAKHWDAHVGAQESLDRGAIGASDAERIWRETKSEGADDVAAFESARASFKDVKGTCARVLPETFGTAVADRVDFCTNRAEALADVVSAGDAVVGQWKDHLAKVGSTPHRVGSVSGWESEVSAAGPALSDYDSAVHDLSSTTSCPT